MYLNWRECYISAALFINKPTNARIAQENIVELAWTNELSVGNATIDTDHKKLIDMTNHIMHAIKATNGADLSQAFKNLETWLPAHFANEEKIVRAIQFPADQQDKARQYSMTELQHIRDELVAKEGIWSDGAVDHFCQFLQNWALEHITKTDMPMKPALLSLSYDFEPA